MKDFDRREFLKFLGFSTYALSNMSLIGSLSGCSFTPNSILGISPTNKDDLVLAQGLTYQKIISFGDPISSSEVFGFNNDYIALEPINEKELLMWVNHEYVNPIFVAGEERTKENVDKERQLVGGSIIKIQKENNHWSYVRNSPHNRAIRGTTKIPFNGGHTIRGQNYAIGTLGNCAGGKTPWGTFLTCEENYQDCYGERNRKTDEITPSMLAWEKFYNYPPEHYGWVVEINPHTGAAKKHTSIGRFAHECATCVISKKGNVVVYSGDDKNNEFIYKFISDASDNLDKGTLYVANIEKGQWLPLDLEKSPILKKHFNNQLDVLVYAREAGKILGATEMDRPEDIEIHPFTGDIYVTLTNNKKKKNFHGQILRLSENNKDYNSMTFKSEVFLAGGEKAGFSCPDNLAFDKKGNLWMCSDISGSAMGKNPYQKFCNNGLFVIPTTGPQAGIPIQIGSAPIDAEFTGLCFTPDYKTLFLSVQHPGEMTKDLKRPTSHWPDGGIPKSSVVAITGPLLDQLVGQHVNS